MDDIKEDYGRYIHSLSKKIKYLADENLVKQHITLEQVKALHYLCINCDKVIYQKDIEKNFEVKRSTVTSILQTLEKKGLILRTEDETDARMKKVLLTQKGKQLSMELGSFIYHLQEVIVEGFSEEDKEKFLTLLKSALNNVIKYNLDLSISRDKI